MNAVVLDTKPACTTEMSGFWVSEMNCSSMLHATSQKDLSTVQRSALLDRAHPLTMFGAFSTRLLQSPASQT
jgi:hypothetical protein